MSTYRRESIIIAVAAVAVRLAFHIHTGFTADDAFITFRYAENIATGLGFVYNQGEHVLGTTTPLFTFILAFLRFFQVPLVPGALIVSLLASAATAVILFRWASRLRFRQLALLPAVCYILWPRSLAADTSGMETALFTFFVTAAFYYRYRDLDYYAIGMATLASLTRPEGGIALLIIFIALSVHHPRRWWHYAVFAASLIGPWVIFATYYYGTPIPHSVTAKLALYSQFGTMPPGDTLVYLLALHNPFGWLMVITSVSGVFWLKKYQNAGLLEALWLICMVVFFTLSGSRIFFWYIAPIYPVELLLATATAMWFWDRLSTSRQQNGLVLTALVVVLVGILLAGDYRPLNYYKQYQQHLEAAHKQVGLYLFAESEPADLVAAEDIGYIGFYSRRRILDRDGLVSPEAVPYNRRGEYLQLLLDFKPEWVVAAQGSPLSPFLADSRFLSAYDIQRTFGEEPYLYDIYRLRREAEAP